MEFTSGTRIGPYELLELLGAGGMGEVWKARDTRLSRVVAIKRLSSQDAARIEREARAIAALSHPHICQIFNIGVDYLVLEFVAGAPLQGPLAAKDALRLATQVASALEAAHECGVLHRDLKPGNILVTKAGVKLLDFGLAKLTADVAPDITASITGTVMGTPAYMSPEQAQGKSIDARSDVFSFGAVLYEMVSGKHTFRGETMLDLLNAVVKDEPAPLDSPVWPVVQRCLAKNPAQRFQTAGELRQALETTLAKLTSGSVELGPDSTGPSIAVLPFANMSRDPDDEYFSDGLAEEILNILAHVPGLKVTARTSSFAFRGKEQDIRRIAEALGVKAILEGSVRRADNRIRVTAQLINAADGYHVWSERYDREMSNVFAMQDEIAAAIAGALRLNLAPRPAAKQQLRYEGPAPSRRQPDVHPEAYEAYLKGRHFLTRGTGVDRSLEYFNRAIVLDPNYAAPHAGVASCYVLLGVLYLRPPHEVFPRAKQFAQYALERDNANAEAHTALPGIRNLYDWDWRGAEEEFRRALELDPNLVDAHSGYAILLNCLRRYEEAIAEMNEARVLDPLSVGINALLGFVYMHSRRYDRAIESCRQAVELDSNSPFAHWLLARSLDAAGETEQALAESETAARLSGNRSPYSGHLGYALARARDQMGAARVLQELCERQKTEYVSPYEIALT